MVTMKRLKRQRVKGYTRCVRDDDHIVRVEQEQGKRSGNDSHTD